MKKRLMSLLLTAAMIVSMVVVPTAAADPVTVSVDSVSGQPGETVTVGINLENLTDDEYIGAFQIDIAFDTDVLESVAIKDGRKEVQILQNKEFWEGGTFQSTLKTDVISLGAMNSDGWPGSGKVGEMQFKIKDDVSVEETELTVTLKKITLLEMDNSQTDITANITAKAGIIDIIYPVTATTGDPEQKTVTSAVLNGSYTKNVDTAEVTASGIKWGTAENALTNTADFGAEVTAAQGATIYYQAYATVGGVNYVGEIKSIVLAGPTATAIAISGADSIEVTFEDNTTAYTAAVKDQFGGDFETTVEWSLVDAPAGVSISDAGVVTVTKAAQSGNVTVKAVAGTAEPATKTVAIKRPAPVVDAITITDVAAVSVPTAAVGSATVELTATGVDQFAETIVLDNVQWSISAAEGVSINGNVITVTNKAAAGPVTVTANVNGVTDTFELTIKKDASVPTTVSFKDGDNATISIPTNDTPNTRVFDVVVTDQFGDEMEADVTFAMTGDAFVSAANNTVTVLNGATKDSVYTLTATAGAATDSIEIKVVDIDITWGTITVNANAVYGMTWGQIVTVAPGTAKLDGVDVPGTWTVADSAVVPNAGDQTYTVKFASNDGNYVVTTTGTAAIAQKEISASWTGFTGLVYNGEAVNVTASVNVEGVNVIVTDGNKIDAGDYTATAALDNANYKLSDATASKTYSIAKANVPAFEGAAAQQIGIGKLNNANVIALIEDEVKAYDFQDQALTGTITIERDLSQLAMGTITVEAVFTPDSANFNAYTFSFQLEITEGDPQTVVIADEFHTTEFTYGDAAVDLKQFISVTNGINPPAFTFVSGDETVATIDADGMVTIVAPGMVTITVSIAGDETWAPKTEEMTMIVMPKTLTIDPASLGAVEMIYNGSNFIDDAEKIAAIVANAQLVGIVGSDVVNLELENASITFYDAEGEPAVNVGEWNTVLQIPGIDNANYQLADELAGPMGKILKADPTFTFANLNQYTTNITAVTAEISPVSFDAEWNTPAIVIEYEVPAVEAVECDHVPTEAEPTCDHTDGCAYTEAKDAFWTTDVTLLPAVAGDYKVRATTEGDSNINAGSAEATLKLSAYSGGGGGGGALTMAVTVDKAKNGTVSLSNKFAPKGKEVTITVKPDEGYELKSITVTDNKGNEIEVTEKDGKYVFVMPGTKVTVTPVFGLIEKESATDKFVDLAANAWYSAAVDAMVEKGLMAGVSDDKFAPEMNLSRSMVVQILWAMAGKPAVNYTMTFEDVTAGSWYAEAVRWAASEGISSGYSAEAFGPNDALTREQLAVMLYAYARKQNVDVSVGENTNILSYNDAFSISEWAIPAMQWACGEGLISGTPAGDLLPTTVATRAQVAVILNNFNDLING